MMMSMYMCRCITYHLFRRRCTSRLYIIYGWIMMLRLKDDDHPSPDGISECGWREGVCLRGGLNIWVDGVWCLKLLARLVSYLS